MTPSVSMARVLDHAMRSMYPRRAQREMLLDLGERKGWTERDHEEAVDAVAGWLVDELGLPERVALPVGDAGDELPRIRRLGCTLEARPSIAGIARWVTALADVVGAEPKTLANSVRGRLRSDRPDHRWLRLVLRLAEERGALEAWLYHRRTRDSVAGELARRALREDLDTGDALLLLSLLSLWQRRRPTTAVRANRGRRRKRRETPKPAAAVAGSLGVPSQLAAVAELADRLPGRAGPQLAAVAVEVALTEAHLAPHPVRYGGATEQSNGEEWLSAVEGLLRHGGVDDEALFRFRVRRMRAWRDDSTQPVPAEETVRRPYVRASLALQANREGRAVHARFRVDEEGLLMLMPLLRSRDLMVSS